MEIIEITEEEWTKFEGSSSTGRRVKGWYERNSDGKSFLFKEPKIYEQTGFITFELCTEIIAYYVGKKLGLEIPAIFPVKEQDNYGVLIENFLKKDEELFEAKNVFQRFDEKPAHNIALIKAFLNYIDKSCYMWIEFKKMLIYDCLIGNNDRHDENWGLCFNFQKQTVRFAPIYDNASCLTRELSEEGVETLLNNEQKFEKYISGKKSRPPNLFWDKDDPVKYNHFQLMQKLIENEPETTELIKKFLQINYIDDVDAIIKNIQNLDLPEKYRLSDNRIKAIFRILKSRQEKLQELL